MLRKAIICYADSQFNEGVKICQQALQVKTIHEFEHDIYNAYGIILLEMKNYDEAIKIFDTGIAKFPAHGILYFNKGVAYLRLEKYDLAETWFKKTLLINPYLYGAHYHLALAALAQGKIVPSYMSYMSYLLFSPKGKYAGKSINMLQQISVGTDEILGYKNNRKVYPDPNYQEVEDVIFSKIALDKSYKILTTVDDPISRQIQAVIEKLQYADEDSDFWVQYYLPFFKQTVIDKKFDLLINHMFSNVNIPAIAAYVEKNKKQIDAYTTEAGNYYDKIKTTQELMLKRRDTVSNRYFFDSGVLFGKGTAAKTGKTLIGPWEGRYAGGNLKSKGMYNAAGSREGNWIWYNSKGAVKAKENYLNGKLDGTQDYYFSNGNRSSQESWVNGQLHGISTTYYYGGSIKTTSTYKANKLDGEEKKFFVSGDLAAVRNYVAGEKSGTEKEYFRNGKLESVTQYLDGKAQGIYKGYNDQGILVAEGNFIKGLASGEWKYYYDDGKIKQSTSKSAGLENGLRKEFYATGEPLTAYNVVKDKVDGEVLAYYRSGKIWYTRLYENGVLLKASYLDQKGNTVSTLMKNGENSRVTTYGDNGYKASSVGYNKDGLVNGVDTIFHNTGGISEICYYKDDVLDGKLTTYYKNGKVKSETTMTDDLTNGYYTSFYMNGKVKSEGRIIEDENQGPWYFYNENGKLNASQYYLDGELDGYKEEYYPNGQKSIEYKYYRGWLEEVTNYDLDGKAIATDIFVKGQGKYRLLYPDGKLMAETNYKNGEFEGIFKSYYFDGTPERVCYYKAGMLDSNYVYYQHGGAKSMEGKYANGDKVGLWKYYDDDGKLSSISNYKSGVLDGEYIRYFANGNKKFISVIKNDFWEGPGVTFDPKGALAYQVNYNDDLAISYTFNDSNGKLKENIPFDSATGSMTAFFANGKPSRVCAYIGGEKHGIDREYYENGNLKSEQRTEHNVQQGPAKSYYENGKLESDFNFLDENEHGLCKTYYESGLIKREVNYEFGTIHGLVKIYNESGKLLQTKNYEQGVLKSVKYE